MKIYNSSLDFGKNITLKVKKAKDKLGFELDNIITKIQKVKL